MRARMYAVNAAVRKLQRRAARLRRAQAKRAPAVCRVDFREVCLGGGSRAGVCVGAPMVVALCVARACHVDLRECVWVSVCWEGASSRHGG